MSAAPSRLGVGFGLLLGVFGGAWSAVIAFVCVPWYIRLLGIESYGLIGFFVTLQAAIALLDMGIGATINREVARSAALGNLGHARRLLRSLEVVYAGVAVAIATVIALAAPLIAAFWLKPGALPQTDVDAALRLMGLVIALRWPVGLYYGTLIGLQKPQNSYRIIAAMSTVANVGAVLVLLLVHRAIAAYFVWQAVTALLALLWARWSAWRALDGVSGARFDRFVLANVLMQSVMMSGVAVSGAILGQVDKFVVSSKVPLADFGRYSLATMMASALSILFVPTFNVIYPRLSALVAGGREDEQIAFYRLGTRLFVSCVFPVALSAFCYAYDLIALWTGNADLAASAAPIAGWLCLGAALNGLMYFPGAIQLARGHMRLPFVVNCVLIAIGVPLTIFLVGRFGALGGALGLFSIGAMYVVIGVGATHRFLLPGLLQRWVLRDVLPALAVAAAVVTAGTVLAVFAGPGHIVRLAIATACSIAATAILLLFVYRDTRVLIEQGWVAVGARLRRPREATR